MGPCPNCRQHDLRTVQYCTVLHSTAQYCAVLHSTVQYTPPLYMQMITPSLRRAPQQLHNRSRTSSAELLNQFSYNPILPYTCQNRLGPRGTHDPENVSSLAQPHTHIASRDFITTVPTLTLILSLLCSPLLASEVLSEGRGAQAGGRQAPVWGGSAPPGARARARIWAKISGEKRVKKSDFFDQKR